MYNKPEVTVSCAVEAIKQQTMSTKFAPRFIDILPPDQGLLDQNVTASAYEADE